MEAVSQFVREQGTGSVPEYRKRVIRLAWTYLLIVACALAAIAIILVRGRLLVTLTQRSNVETLTLAVILLLFAYLAVVCAPGAWGALKIVYYSLGPSAGAIQARKQALLRPRHGIAVSAFLNCLVRGPGNGDSPVSIELRDEVGSLGRIEVDGARMCHRDAMQRCSNSLFTYFERRIEDLVRRREPDAQVEIVEWTSIDDESALQYASLVHFGRCLERHLGCPPLWPCVELTEDDLETLRREAAELCPILRDEVHLPDLEYQVEHRLPIIPEPLAFISLSRQEKRADPLASMGCALAVVLIILGCLILFVVLPPWVPGK